jgi:radial spoke head protein 4A
VEVTGPLESLKPEQWSFRLAPGGAGAAASSVVVARSLVWPGAIAVAAGRKYLNVYVGNGIMYDPVSYTPPMPAPIQQEWAPASEDEPGLTEQPDVRIDPTPPAPEGAAEEE